MERSGKDGRKLDNPEDFVRMEIATALRQNTRVIPFLVDGALMPRSTDLPDDLKPLRRRNALRISDNSFNDDCRRSIASLEQALQKADAERKQKEEKARLNRAEAIAEFSAAIQSNPNFAKAYFQRSYVYRELGQINLAARDLATARQLELVPAPTNVETPTTKVEANAEDHYQRGLALEGEGNRVDAIAEFTAAIRSNPNSATAYYHRS
jgi:tetratricopeptide (TPR) repeat protein